MTELLQKKCKPCEGGVPPLSGEELAKYQKEVSEEWKVIDGKKIHREFSFKNFAEAMNLANKIAEIADEENHHPDLIISYGKVVVELSTHAIKGLSENDFILAAKIDAISE